MNRFLLDSSIALSWCFEDEVEPGAEAMLDALTTRQWEAVVPALWFLEIANVLLLSEKRGRLTRSRRTDYLQILQDLPITSVAIPEARAYGALLNLAERYDLTIYDSCYLDLALEKHYPLATKDAALEKAAKKAGVPIVTTAFLKHPRDF